MDQKVCVPIIPDEGYNNNFKQRFDEFQVTASFDFGCYLNHDHDTVSHRFKDIEEAVKVYKLYSYLYINTDEYRNATVTLVGYVNGSAVVLQSITDTLNLYFDYIGRDGNKVFSNGFSMM